MLSMCVKYHTMPYYHSEYDGLIVTHNAQFIEWNVQLSDDLNNIEYVDCWNDVTEQYEINAHL